MTKFRPDTNYTNVVENPTSRDLERVISEKYPTFHNVPDIVQMILDEATERKARLTRTYTIGPYVAVEHAPDMTPRKITVLAYIRKTLIDFRTPSDLNFDGTGPTFRRVKLSGYLDITHEKRVDSEVIRCNGCFMTIPTATDCPNCEG